MDFSLLFPLVFLIYFDLHVLKQLDETLFLNVFGQSTAAVIDFIRARWRIVIIMIVFILGCYLVLIPINKAWSFIVYFSLFIFLLRRRQFKKSYIPLPADNPQAEFRLALAANSFDILWTWFLSMIAVVVLMKVLKEVFPAVISRLDELVALAAISSILMVIVIKKFVPRVPLLTLKEALGLKTAGLSKFKLIILPILFGITFAAISSAAMYSRVQQPNTPLNDILETTTSSWAIVFFVLTAVVLAPFLEEIIFRGFFFFVLKECRGPVFAVVLISLIFGFLHMDQYWGDWIAIAAVMILGFGLTLLRWRLNSSIPGVIAHYFYNATMVVIPILTLLLQHPSYMQYQMNYQKLTDPQKEELLLKSIEESPAHAPSYNDLAWVYAQEGKDFPEALQLIEQALSLEPDNSSFLDTKAEVLYKMGRYGEAVQVGEKVLEKFSDKEYARKQLQKFQDALKQSQH